MIKQMGRMVTTGGSRSNLFTYSFRIHEAKTNITE